MKDYVIRNEEFYKGREKDEWTMPVIWAAILVGSYFLIIFHFHLFGN